MADMFDYLQWRGDLTFKQDPPNCVDALILSTLCYIDFAGSLTERPDIPISLREASEEFFRRENADTHCRVKADMSLLMAAAETKRFGDTLLMQYRNILIPEEETQFAAVTFLLDNDTGFITFRGTDYTLTGWKEDFNMTFLDSVPAQLLAADYVREIGEKYHMPLQLSGHSKGGNLAVYAAVKSEPWLREKIRKVYNHDGPGFTEFLLNDPAYQEMLPKITTIVPQSSVIGMLLEHEEPYTIIKSKQIGLLQHDPYSWEIMGKNFIPMEEISSRSRFFNDAIKRWLAEMSREQRNEIVDTVFQLLGAGDAQSVFDLVQPKNVKNYLRILTTDAQTRKTLSRELMNFLEAAHRTQLALENE